MKVCVFDATNHRSKEQERLKVKVGPDGAACAGQKAEEGTLCYIAGFDKITETFEGIPKTPCKEKI